MTATTATTALKTVPVISHAKAAESHDVAAKTLRMAAESHRKGDHQAGLVHADNAVKLSQTAYEAAKGACAESKTAAH